jgi:glycosyltransferase involved in cell wall biosynthesis
LAAKSLAPGPRREDCRDAAAPAKRSHATDRFNRPLTSLAPPRSPLRVAALVDLPRSARAGGHVKYWERLAAVAAEPADGEAPLDLTVYFSGDAPDETIAPNVRLRHLPPVFSTQRLKFLPYVPDHTDLAPWHPRLARQLPRYDLIHATDGFFAFARTAERVARSRGIPLTTSLHTDTPAYARLFTRQTIEALCARRPWLQRKLIDDWGVPERQGARMDRRLARHLRQCAHAFVTRAEDQVLAQGVLDAARVSLIRVGVDKAMFGPHRRDIVGVRRDYAIPEDRVIALFVGRVDAGKNVGVLKEAVAQAIAKGAPLHLIVAGLGPMAQDLAQALDNRVSLPGFVEPDELARLYASVDFLALPSEVEIHSMAAVEAIASGCPAMVARAAGSTSQFGATPAVLAVDGGTRNWAAAMRDLAADPERREAMRQAALAYRDARPASWSEALYEDFLPGWRAALSATRGDLA